MCGVGVRGDLAARVGCAGHFVEGRLIGETAGECSQSRTGFGNLFHLADVVRAAFVGRCTRGIVVDVLERITFRKHLARQASVAIIGAGGDLAQRVDRFHYFAESIHIGDFADWPRPYFL